MRPNKITYYLNIACAVAHRSTCRRRKFGAVIVKNDEVIATGYNGAPRARQHCSEMESCIRDSLNIPKGQRYELCRSVHAEANAIISASRAEMTNGSLFLVCIDAKTDRIDSDVEPCSMCKRFILNAGISKVYVRTEECSKQQSCGFKEISTEDWVTNDDSLELHEGY